jgi:hypothetical protein
MSKQQSSTANFSSQRCFGRSFLLMTTGYNRV